MRNSSQNLKTRKLWVWSRDKSKKIHTECEPSYPYGFHTASYAPPDAPGGEYTNLPRQPTVRIYCEANRDYSVTARNSTAVLAPANSNDQYQHWIKDMSYSHEIKDVSGYAAFALVNRVTGEALKNPTGENQPVGLVPYNRNSLEKSVRWSEVKSTGYRAIRLTHTPALYLTAVASDSNFTDPTEIVVTKWVSDSFHRWVIVPYNSNVPY